MEESIEVVQVKDLKPCPLCGHNAVVKVVKGHHMLSIMIFCTHCHNNISNVSSVNNEDGALGDIVEKWNLRIDEPVTLKNIAHLNIKDKGVLVIKGEKELWRNQYGDRYAGRLRKMLDDNYMRDVLIIFQPEGLSLDYLDEGVMDSLGWVRKERVLKQIEEAERIAKENEG